MNSIGTSTNCADFMRTAKGTAVLDGRRLGPEVYQGDEISVQAAAGNPITESAGRFTTTGCGVWVQLPPLAPGRHTLTIRGESAGFSVGVDYSLDVGSASGAGSASA
ncbi:hypothetical protein ACFYT4_32920 [Streptomyces sp. NPDC004609]|uniref:hypothetical protein n=1 Tax=Streptomyces sp. NPDC004609 TaxID=3364704 RepID=UPI00367806B1